MSRPAATPESSGRKPLRDAVLATAALAALVFAGSGGLEHLDHALVGYLGAVFVTTFATVLQASAFWRRRPSAFYGRALAAALRPSRLHTILAHAGRDLAAQGFVRRRSRVRWVAHLLLSLGTLASFAITVPLVCGWLRFEAEDATHYRAVVFMIRTARFAVDGVLAWLVFHGLTLAGVAVALGAAMFLGLRARSRGLPGATSSFAIAPLLLLLAVALTGLALPATRHIPELFGVAAALHEIAVIVLLIAIPYSKLGHVLIRPLQLGARAVHEASQPRAHCTSCGGPLAPAAQHDAVARLLAERGIPLASHVERCPACRRRQVAAAQADLVGAHFQPSLLGARPASASPARREAA